MNGEQAWKRKTYRMISEWGTTRKKQIFEGIYLFYVALITLMAYKDTTMIQYQWTERQLQLVCLTAILVVVFKLATDDSWDLREVMLSMLVCCVMIASWRHYMRRYILELTVLIIGARGVSFRKIVKVFFCVSLFALLLTVYMALSGRIDNLVYYVDEKEKDASISFGSIYPTDFSMHVCSLVFCYFWLRGKKLRVKELLAIAGIGLFCLLLCNARNSAICIWLSCAAMGWIHWLRGRNEGSFPRRAAAEKCMTALGCAAMPVLAVCSIGLSALYTEDNVWMRWLNRFFNNRLMLGKKGLTEYAVTLLGQEVRSVGYGGSTQTNGIDYFFIDSSYLNVLLRYGLLMLVILLFAYVLIVYRLSVRGKWEQILIMMLLAVHCTIEHHLIEIAYHPFFLALLASHQDEAPGSEAAEAFVGKLVSVVRTAVLEYIIIFGMFGRYFENLLDWTYWLVVFCMAALFTLPFGKEDTDKNRTGVCVVFGIVAALLTLNYHIGGDAAVFQGNMLQIFYPLLICVTLCAIFPWLSRTAGKLFVINSIAANVFWVANLVIVTLQLVIKGFLIRPEWLEMNRNYPDQCCGLFGNSGTHALAMFTVFILVLNLYLETKLTNRKWKIALLVYTILTMIYMLILSAQNDNAALFILVPFFSLFFYFAQGRASASGRRKRLGYCVILLTAGCAILLLLPVTREFLSEVFLERIRWSVTKLKAPKTGSAERLAIVVNALGKSSGWMLGDGIGVWGWSDGGYNGFSHFGLNSVSSFITLGGIWFYLLYCVLYVMLSLTLIREKRRKVKFGISVFLSIGLISVYTEIFTYTTVMIWLWLTIYVLAFKCNESEARRPRRRVRKNGKNSDRHDQSRDELWQQTAELRDAEDIREVRI